MRAGKLDRVITIEQPNPGAIVDVSSAGFVTVDWVTLATMRAEMTAQEVVEQVGDKGASTIERITFRTRWVDGVTLNGRVTYQGKTYNLKGVTEIQRRRGLEITVERIGP
jgi:head-tail adaptor